MVDSIPKILFPLAGEKSLKHCPREKIRGKGKSVVDWTLRSSQLRSVVQSLIHASVFSDAYCMLGTVCGARDKTHYTDRLICGIYSLAGEKERK